MRKLSLKELNRVDIDTFRQQEKTPLVLVLDNIRSGLNVGAAFRTADAFALQKIILCGITAKPPHREILKTAIGASQSVAWAYEKETEKALARLREEGFTLVAIEQAEGSVPLQSFQALPDKKYALIFGNEVIGVSAEVVNKVDACIEVPQFGTKHSLNIAVCIGIVAWDLFKKMKLD